MAIVGYYSMSTGSGLAGQIDEITNNGDTAVNITVPNAAQLASLDSLYVVNPSNSGFGQEYMTNLPAIAAAVSGGMNLIIFDRAVTNAQTTLPGGSGITVVRDFADGANVDVAAGAPASFTNGPNGPITDTTFYGGNYSNHGYAELSSLPPGATPLLTTSDPTHIVAFTYPFGSGNVFYSTIPLDFYTSTNNSAISPADIFTLFGAVEDVLCFTRGAMIQTARGLRAVEELNIGDAVFVASGGTKRIRWISSSRLGAAALRRCPKNRPVRITAGALGEGLPHRDLLVSRQHRMLLNSQVAQRMFGAREVLVAAIKLVELPGIFVDEDVEEVVYFHILFDDHEIIWAEGAASESLFTGRQALLSIPPAARAELETLFPDMISPAYQALAAAFIPSGKHQKQLVARHVKNHKAVYQADPRLS
jgi:hypothetical protein